MSLKFYFLRHGQTELSRDDTFCGSGLNPNLTDQGQAMAQAFADAYSNTSWQAIVTSSLQRTIATAKPLCDRLRITSQSHRELDEIAYGKWEGLTKSRVNEEFHDDYIRWLDDPAWNAPTGGELALTVAGRSMELIERLTLEVKSGNILVVSHKATIRVVLCALLGIDVGRFRYRLVCPVGSVSIVEFGAEGPLLHSLADRSHFNETLKNLPGT